MSLSESIRTRLSDNYIIHVVILVVTVAFLVAPHIQGVGVNDDGSYTRVAVEQSAGNWKIESDGFTTRFLVTLPLTAAIKLGIGIKWLPVVTLLQFLCLVIFMYFLISKITGSNFFTLLGALFFASSPFLIQNATLTTGDILHNLLLSSGVLLIIFSHSDFTHTQGRKLLTAACAAMLFFASFVAKETTLFFLPVLLGLCVYQIQTCTYSKNIKCFWGVFFLTAAFLSVATLFGYHFFTGNALFLINTIVENSKFVDPSLCYDNTYALLLRVTLKPFQFMLLDFTFGISFILAVAGLFKRPKNPIQAQLKLYFVLSIVIWWVVVPLVIRPWNPIGLFHRIWMPVLIPMMLNALLYILNIQNNYNAVLNFKTKIFWCVMLAGVLVSSCISYFEYIKIGGNVLGIFLPVAVYSVCILFIILNRPQKAMLLNTPVLLIIIVLPQLAIGLLRVNQWVDGGMENQFDKSAETLRFINLNNPKLVLTDPNAARNFSVFIDGANHLNVKSYNTFYLSQIPDSSYLWINRDRHDRYIKNLPAAYNFAKTRFVVHPYLIHPTEYGFVKVFDNGSDCCYLYKKLS
ncbi:MAG: hypothetical protein JNK66_05330 [Chitinophagales bacterium]|nr:hypothetical protein [Chitinophagales bacterium]